MILNPVDVSQLFFLLILLISLENPFCKQLNLEPEYKSWTHSEQYCQNIGETSL